MTGTFVANTVGTWIVGIWLTLSRYAIPYYDTAIQALLFGLVTGLCGCMTTVSTFVAEIDILPPKASYWYAFLTNAAGQLGLLFLFRYVYLAMDTSHTCTGAGFHSHVGVTSQYATTFSSAPCHHITMRYRVVSTRTHWCP